MKRRFVPLREFVYRMTALDFFQVAAPSFSCTG
jgi:hypothetical protein